MKRLILSLISLLSILSAEAQVSPNGKIRAEYVSGKGLVVSYKQSDRWQEIMAMPSEYDKLTSTTKKTVNYPMILGKKSQCKNACKQGVYMKSNGDNKDVLVVKVYNDGVAFSGPMIHDYKVDFTASKNNWIQRWTEGYEEFFPLNREQKSGNRYAYPALFEYEGDVFALLSESCMKADMAATSMYATDSKNVFELRPDGKENGGSQTLIIGSLADVVESTLILDNSEPCKLAPEKSLNSQRSTLDWIQPGVASWVYWAYNHGSNDYNIIKKYTNMAIDLHLPYVLIDAEWDNFLPPYKVEDAIKYAVDCGIKPIIWYSSSIGWLNGAPGPKFRLNKPEDREKEFAWLESLGVTGVKIDFFSGDTNQNIKFMIELLEDAAKHHLLVNFHGATIPRGWQRTYPNLVSTEGVYGAEWYNNVPTFTNRAAKHNATLPFTRNVVGSMDYTPCAFSDSQHPHITTHAHELALTALYESAVQHLADRPESFLAQPQAVKEYLTHLPTAWDETRLLSGYPGEDVVMARRKGNIWYVAGINGTDSDKVIKLDTKLLKKFGNSIQLFEDSGDKSSPWKISNPSSVPSQLNLQPRGGFVMTIRKYVGVGVGMSIPIDPIKQR